MAILDTFIALRNYVKGKIDKYELEDSDDMITSIRENAQTKGQSMVFIEFDDETSFLESLGISNDDVWFYRVVNSGYETYEFIDWYSAKEDFENGWGLYYMLDDENKETLSKIAKIILPMKVDWDSEQFRNQLSEKLLTHFRNETEDIISDYRSERNIEMSNTASEKMNKEINDYLSDFGLEVYRDGFKTTVGNLIMLYMKEGDIHLSLEDLFKKIFKETDILGGWQENQFEFQNDENFDNVGFNSQVSRNLDSILEKLEDTESVEGVSIKDYLEMTNRITNKFEQGKYYTLPKDPKKETRFRVDGFEFPNMKVVVSLSKGLKRKTIKISEENFFNLLYQPTLFNLEEI